MWLTGTEPSEKWYYLSGQWPTLRRMLHVPLIYVTWPWLTFVTPMIFRASMRRAKVKTVHVLRCTLCSCDAGVLLIPLGGLLGGASVAYAFLPALQAIGIDYRMIAALVFAGYTSYRLAAAYSLYMRFDRPAATALASQGIVLLFVLIVLSWRPRTRIDTVSTDWRAVGQRSSRGGLPTRDFGKEESRRTAARNPSSASLLGTTPQAQGRV